MLSLSDAKRVLRIDSSNTANDALILSLCEALPDYIELTTGMTKQNQINEALVDTVGGFLMKLWYFADQTDDVALNRTIENLLKCITLKANAQNRAAT